MTEPLDILHRMPLEVFIHRADTPVGVVRRIFGRGTLVTETWCCSPDGLRQDGAVAILRTPSGCTGVYLPQYGDARTWRQMSTGARFDAIETVINKPLVVTQPDLLTVAEQCVRQLAQIKAHRWSLHKGETVLRGPWNGTDAPFYSHGWLLRLALAYAAPSPDPDDLDLDDQDGVWTMLGLATDGDQAQRARDIVASLGNIWDHRASVNTLEAEALMMNLVHQYTGYDIEETTLWRNASPAALLALPKSEWAEAALCLLRNKGLLDPPTPDPASPTPPPGPSTGFPFAA